MKSNKSRVLNGGKKALTACSAGILALCLGLGSSDLQAQSAARSSVRVCIGSQGINLSAKSSKTVVDRVAAAAKRGRLTMPVPASGKGSNTKLACKPATKKAKSSTRVLKIGMLDGGSLSDLLEGLLKALLGSLGSNPLTGDANSNSLPGVSVALTNIINAVDATEAAGTRFAALDRTNFVFVRDTVRAVENRFVGEDPNGQTLFELKIPQSASSWVRLLNDLEAKTSLEARLIPSPGGGVQLNEFVYRRSADDSMLVIHAPEITSFASQDRDQLEILLSYSDVNSGGSVKMIRLPLSKLLDVNFNFLGGSGPLGALRIGRDASGQQYYARSIMGLNGMALGVLEFPEYGQVGRGSRVIFKSAVINNWDYQGGLPSLSGTGMAFQRRGVGYMEAASITMANPNFRNMFGPLYALDGIVDNLTVLLRDSVRISSDARANASAIGQRISWDTFRLTDRIGSAVQSLNIVDVD